MTITIDNVTAMFTVDKENMPRISIQQMVPTYTSLLVFQDTINENAMAIPSWQCPDLGHLALVTMIPKDFTTANDGVAFVIPVQPADPTTALPGPIPAVVPAAIPGVAGQVPALVAVPAVAGQVPAPLDHFTALEK